MQKKVFANRRVEVSCETICNRCGEQVPDQSFVSLYVDWGWESPKDGQEHTSHICEKCYDEFVGTFKIPPEVEYPW